MLYIRSFAYSRFWWVARGLAKLTALCSSSILLALEAIIYGV